MIIKLWKLPICWKHGHPWQYYGETLGGIWIRCTRCGILDEFLPGTHEPKGAEPIWQALLHKPQSEPDIREMRHLDGIRR